MPKKFWFVSILLAATFFRQQKVEAQPFPLNIPGEFWFGLDLDIGYGTSLERDGRYSDMLWRIRGGAAWIDPYWILTMGATAQLVGLEKDANRFALGAQLEVLHITSGLSCYLGAHAYFDRTVGASIGAGWSIFYLELEVLSERTSMLFFKVRLPLSIAAYALREKYRLRGKKLE